MKTSDLADWTCDFDGKYFASYCSPDGMTAVLVDRVNNIVRMTKRGESAWSDMARRASDMELTARRYC